MKAVISNRIYISGLSAAQKTRVMKELTYKIKKNTGNPKFNAIETIRNYKQVTPDIISIPQQRMDLVPEDFEIIDKRVLKPVEFPGCNFELYEEQVPVFHDAVDTCIINAMPGWGKSFTALHIAKKFGQKTLIVVHTVALRDQWEEEVFNLFGIEASIIGSGKKDYSSIITITNTQTYVKLAEKFGKEFGTIVVDEMHHTSSTTFSSIIDKSHARYRLGLSATLKRKDQKHVVFQDYFGTRVLQPPQANTLSPKIKIIKTNTKLNMDLVWTDRITQLNNNVNYQNFLVEIAKVQVKKGHKVLLIADRVEFLHALGDRLGDRSIVVTGNTNNRKEAKEGIISGEYDVIVGSRAIMSEGISVNPLSCVILGVPINNDSLLEQVIGRVQRQYEGKLNPEVIDVQFADRVSYYQSKSRLGLYLRKCWLVETIES